MLEKTIEMGYLFDFYGKMLTDKQQQIMRLYYHHDLSLGEIAEKIGISRQGVYDHLKRGEKILREYDEEMGLIKRYRKTRDKLNELISYIDSRVDVEESVKKELIKRLNELEKQL